MGGHSVTWEVTKGENGGHGRGSQDSMADEAGKAECERIFKRFDVNGDGKISLSELEIALNALGSSSSHDEVCRRMAQIDKDGNGIISLDELCDFQRANPDLMKEVCNRL